MASVNTVDLIPLRMGSVISSVYSLRLYLCLAGSLLSRTGEASSYEDVVFESHLQLPILHRVKLPQTNMAVMDHGLIACCASAAASLVFHGSFWN